MSTRSRAVLLSAVAAALALTLSACGKGGTSGGGGNTNFVTGHNGIDSAPRGKRAAAPDLSGTTIDGKALDVANYKGQVVVVNVWGSWCGPCREEAQYFSKVSKQYEGKGVRFVGVDVKETDKQFAQAFVNRFAITFPSLYDPRGEVALAFRDYPANAIPSTIVLDPRGRVAAVYTGTVAQEDLRKVLDRLQKEG